MITLVKDTEKFGRIVLTTESAVSKYNLPVLSLEEHDWQDLGPSEVLPTGITAAEFVCRCAAEHGASAELVAAAIRFLSQWPDGPQLTAGRVAAEISQTWEE